MKHIVGISGGIDSQAAGDWVLEQFGPDDTIFVNSDAGGNEDPITTDHIEWYSASVHPVVMLSPIIADLGGVGTRSGQARARRSEYADSDALTFDALAYIKGRFPSKTAQFCTSFLKLAPQRRWTQEAFGVNGIYAGEDYERYTGVRRDESKDRKDAPERFWDDYFDCWLNQPLVDWTKTQCFAYVASRGERVNPLYSLGFSRVGCAPCVNSNKDDILAWFQRRPEMIAKVGAWEQRVGRTYFPPMVPGLVLNRIDQVIEWAQTSHGGRQRSILRVLNDRPACESKYGLCE